MLFDDGLGTPHSAQPFWLIFAILAAIVLLKVRSPSIDQAQLVSAQFWKPETRRHIASSKDNAFDVKIEPGFASQWLPHQPLLIQVLACKLVRTSKERND